MRNWFIVLASIVLAGGIFATVARSEEKASPSAGAATGGAPSADQMAEWMKMNAPGEQHAALKKMVGTFTADCTMKMTADAPEMKSKGKLTNGMVLNGRYLHGEYDGDFMGQPFKGMSLNGYDSLKKKHFSAWIDDMSTGLMTMEGSADSSGKTITYTGECPCPEEGGKMKAFKQVVTITDDDHYKMEMFTPDKDGKEFRSMNIEYARVK